MRHSPLYVTMLHNPEKKTAIILEPLFPPFFSVAKFDLVTEGLTSLSRRIFDHPTVDFLKTRMKNSEHRRHQRHSSSGAPRAPTPFDASGLTRVLGGVSLMTNQLVLRFEAAAVTPLNTDGGDSDVRNNE